MQARSTVCLDSRGWGPNSLEMLLQLLRGWRGPTEARTMVPFLSLFQQVAKARKWAMQLRSDSCVTN